MSYASGPVSAMGGAMSPGTISIVWQTLPTLSYKQKRNLGTHMRAIKHDKSLMKLKGYSLFEKLGG
jgi:hypothetical protein